MRDVMSVTAPVVSYNNTTGRTSVTTRWAFSLADQCQCQCQSWSNTAQNHVFHLTNRNRFETVYSMKPRWWSPVMNTC